MKTKTRTWQCHLLFVCLLILSGSTASAYDFSFDGIYYNYKNDGLEVAGAESSIQDVIIPSQVEYEGKIWMVTSIGENAFIRSNILSIIIPNTVTSIGKSAFYFCLNLKSVTIPDSITSIESYTFCNCQALTSLSIPNTVTSIGESAFDRCRSLEFISIPGSVRNIKGSAFYDCVKLKEVSFEDGEAEILIEYGGNSGSRSGSLFNYCPLEKVYLGRTLTINTENPECSAFYGKESLVSVTIGDSVTHLGDYTFFNCTGLTTIAIPKSVTTIGEFSFRKCTGLTNISIPNSVTIIGRYAFSDCTGLTNISIPNSVKTIGERVFNGCVGLTTFSIPNSVDSIGKWSFDGCSNLHELIIEEGSTQLSFDGEYSKYFQGCPLNTIYLGRNIIFTGYSPFQDLVSLNNITISSSVTDIKSKTFYGCTGLKELKFEDGIEKLSLGEYDFSGDGKGLFADCPLESIQLGRNLTYAEWPFAHIETLTTVTISNSVTSIGEGLFYGCTGLKSISIPNSVTTIEDQAFTQCSGLISVDLPNSVKDLGSNTFSGCTNLSSVNLPESITYIGPWTFQDCKSLESISIPYSVKFISGSAFGGCIGLTSISIPNSVEDISQNAFWHCTNINSVRFEDGGNPLSIRRTSNSLSESLFCDSPIESAYLGRTLLYKENTVSPFKNKGNLINLTISDYVTEIGPETFKGCSGLTSLVIPNSVTIIGSEAFSGCQGLTSVSIPKSVLSIGELAFGGTNLKELVLEDGENPLSLEYSKDRGVFQDCPLKMVHLGRNLIYSSANAPFYNLTSLDSLTISNTVTAINDNSFYGCTGLKSLVIPNSIVSIGYSAFRGCTGLNSLSIPGTVTSIGYAAFEGCANIRALTFQDGKEPVSLGTDNYSYRAVFAGCPLDSIYLGRNLSYSKSPFRNMATLKNVDMSNSVTQIESEEFYGCSGLSSISMHDAVISIGDKAFYGCTALGTVSIPNTVTSIGDAAFYGCSSLKTVSIPNTLTSIGNEAFYGCESLSSIPIPAAVKTIGNSSFARCEAISSIVIPNSVVSIGNSSFEGCSGLKFISFGKSLHKIGELAFSGCNPDTIETFSYKLEGIEASGLSQNKLVTIKIDSDYAGIGSTNMTYFDQVVIKDKEEKEQYALVESPQDMDFSNSIFNEMNYYIIPLKECNAKYTNDNQYVVFRGKDITNSMKSEDGFSFTPSIYHSENVFTLYGDANDSSLTRTIHLDQAGTLFDKLDLNNIEKIETLTLSGDINGTDVMTINRMTALKYLDIKDAKIVEGGMTYRDNLKTADNVVGERFFNDIKLEVLHLPNTAYKIEKNAFVESPLKVVTIPPSVKRVECCAFANCSALTTITIPGSVKEIEFEAFAGTSIKDAIFEDGAEELKIGSRCFGNSVFQSISLKTLYLGRNILYDYDSPLALSSLTDLIISESVTSIGEGEFQGTSIRHLTLPESIKTLGKEAFSYCTKLESIVIPQSATSIGETAFMYCNRLCTVSLPDNLERIEDGVFYGCRSLISVLIPEKVTSIGKSAFENCSGLTSVQIPLSVKSIGTGAFIGCSSLSSISVPEGIETIEERVFKDCISLSSILIPQSVTSIGSYAFNGCTSLSEVNIPASITSIGEYAFYKTALKEVLLPASVIKIGDYAFGGNSGIEKVLSLNTTPPEIFTNTFDSDVEASIPLHVQKGSLMYYWLDPVWKEFKNISDDVLCLQAIPNAKYGDGEIDLSKYAPEGVALTYQSSNEDVVRINGSSMRIVGAGEATVAAILDEDGTTTELVGQLRSIVVDKADLTVSVEEIVIEEGSPIPDFTYTAEGLQYDDTLEDIDNLPQPVHEVDEHSPVGEYAVTFTDGSDHNYRIATNPSRITVTPLSGVKENMSDASEKDIEVYDLNGLLVYRGPRSGTILQKGTYIVRQGKTARKITVR